jgi:hypothetical protein
MELNIYELEQDNNMYEEIPENTFPTKVIKNVHFDDKQRPIHQSIPRVNAKMVRPKMPNQAPKISYEDILSKMGMFVSDGKLHLVDRNTLSPEKQKELMDYQRNKQYQEPSIPSTPSNNQNIPQNSYIYNKLFKDQIQHQPTVRKPKTIQEYKRMLVEDYLIREKNKQIKSTKLIMPTSNINISDGNSRGLQNRLFSFSNK